MAAVTVRQAGVPRTLTWLALLALALAAVVAIVLTSDATGGERAWLLVALASTGAAGVGIARAMQLLLPRLSLRTQLALATVTGFVVLVANLAVAAAMMFINTHDLQMLFLLSAYALLITLGPARLLSGGLSGRIEAIEAGARRLASGELGTRVEVDGRDELAELAREFNRMADALEAADVERQAVESSRRDLFAAISHDLRTPLASIRVRVEALLDGVVTDDETRTRYLAGACQEVERLSALIDDLFELTTLDSGELRLRLEMLPIQDVIAEAVDIFRPQVEKAGIRLTFTPGDGATTVLADPNRLSRVIYNLLQNAIRHTPNDGAIILQTARVAEGVEIAVRDTGEGIPPEDLPHVFDRFYRGDKSRSREHGGSGLGLAIARAIVEAHGGDISVMSQQGEGTTFTFVLPATQP